MAAELIRIVSDVHFADGSSRVTSLEQLRPLFEGVSSVVLNGDTVDTRPGPEPALTRCATDEVTRFLDSTGVPVTLVTGNHDPDISDCHSIDLADGGVFVTHGDALYDSIVPWSSDARFIRPRIIARLAALPVGAGQSLEQRLRVVREVAASVPRKKRPSGSAAAFALRIPGMLLCAPDRVLRVLRAWRQLPRRADAFASRFRPLARFMLIGHTHRPGIWTLPSGATVVNTGSFCRPFQAWAADVAPGRLTIRRIEVRRGSFRPGEVVEEIRGLDPFRVNQAVLSS